MLGVFTGGEVVTQTAEMKFLGQLTKTLRKYEKI